MQLSTGSLQVRVFVGRDPVTKKRNYLQENVRQGPDADAEAEKVCRRLLVQVDARLNPRTSTKHGLIDYRDGGALQRPALRFQGTSGAP